MASLSRCHLRRAVVLIITLSSEVLILFFKFYFDRSIIGFYVFSTLVHHVALGVESRIKIRPTSSTPWIIGTVSPVLADLWAAGRVPRKQEEWGLGLVLDGSGT